jgi:hypothetical protein
MKTQIIALDDQEDYLSVRDKLNWSQTGRVLLTWPSARSILTRLDLVMIQRHSAGRGVQLALVTGNAEIRAIAEQQGIPVFDSAKEAQSARWRTSRRRRSTRLRKKPSPDLNALRALAHPAQPAWTSSWLIRWVTFTLSLLALLALLVYTVPAASLTLQPETRPQSITLEVSASPDISQVNLAGRLPSYAVSVIVEARGSLSATGSVLVPFKTAIGGIQFTNLTEEAVMVAAGTVVSTLDNPPVRFATSNAGQVGAGVGHSIILSASALTPGEAGNLPANSLVAVEGLLGLSLSASNLAATHGGSDSTVSGPSETDRQALLEQMTATLQQTAMDEMQSNLPQGDLALTPSLTYLQTLEETYQPEAGQPGEQLELTLRLEFSGQAVSSADLRALVSPPLDATLPDGFSPLPDSLNVRLASTPVIDNQGELVFSITAQRRLKADLPAAQVIALLRGKTSAQASQSLLEALPLASPPHITISPTWWPRLPFNPFRIQVEAASVQ